MKLPPAFRLLWGLHDGQDLHSRQDATRNMEFLLGDALPSSVRHPVPALGLLGGSHLSRNFPASLPHNQISTKDCIAAAAMPDPLQAYCSGTVARYVSK